MDSHILNKKAFSLIDMALSLSLIGMLLAYLLPLGGQIISRIKEARISNDLTAVGQACQQYYLMTGHWPGQLSDLQPYFFNQNANTNFNNYILTPQANILIIALGQNSISVIKPRIQVK